MKSAVRCPLRYPVIVVAVLAAAVIVTSSARAAQSKKSAPEPLGPSLCPAEVNVEQRVADAPQGWEPGLSGLKPPASDELHGGELRGDDRHQRASVSVVTNERE